MRLQDIMPYLETDLIGVADIEGIRESVTIDMNLFPSAKRIVVLACAHVKASLASCVNEARQYDTLSTYDEVRRASYRTAKHIQAHGYEAVAVPAFIPMDMGEGKSGMVGALDHRGAAVAARIGRWGQSGLLITERYGPRVRLASVLTNAPLEITEPLRRGLCLECLRCVEACPAKALAGNGLIDKKKCRRIVFVYGFRGFAGFMAELLEANGPRRKELLGSYAARELWQNFMSGNFYYCWECQAVCPVGS